MAFQPADSSFLDSLLTRREGEVRLGERIALPATDSIDAALAESPAEFVLLGIPEDIGVRANLGLGGAHTAWQPALRTLLNSQSNRFVTGSEILLLGHFDFGDLMLRSIEASVDELRELVAEIDAGVYPVVRSIAAAGKMPIIVGGGHNNAFPILKGCSDALGKPLHCINMDAHSDYRRIEGRHSGNGFRFAKAGGYLNKYALPWLHEAYNSLAVVTELERDPDIFVRYAESGGPLDTSVNGAINFTRGAQTGIELDLDCIAGVLSSAATPSGISSEQARDFVRRCARHCDCAYLHLTEGAVELRDGRKDPLTAKLISYLIRDFIAARKARGTSR